MLLLLRFFCLKEQEAFAADSLNPRPTRKHQQQQQADLGSTAAGVESRSSAATAAAVEGERVPSRRTFADSSGPLQSGSRFRKHRRQGATASMPASTGSAEQGQVATFVVPSQQQQRRKQRCGDGDGDGDDDDDAFGRGGRGATNAAAPGVERGTGASVRSFTAHRMQQQEQQQQEQEQERVFHRRMMPVELQPQRLRDDCAREGQYTTAADARSHQLPAGSAWQAAAFHTYDSQPVRGGDWIAMPMDTAAAAVVPQHYGGQQQPCAREEPATTTTTTTTTAASASAAAAAAGNRDSNSSNSNGSGLSLAQRTLERAQQQYQQLYGQ